MVRARARVVPIYGPRLPEALGRRSKAILSSLGRDLIEASLGALCLPRELAARMELNVGVVAK